MDSYTTQERSEVNIETIWNFNTSAFTFSEVRNFKIADVEYWTDNSFSYTTNISTLLSMDMLLSKHSQALNRN